MMNFVIVLLIAGQNSAQNSNPPIKSSQLLEKLRRQLMQDNYDYLPSDDDWSFPTKTQPPPTTTEQPATEPKYSYRVKDESLSKLKPDLPMDQSFIDNIPIPRANEELKAKNNRYDYNVSRKDLFYYMDDLRMRRMDGVDLNDIGDGELDASSLYDEKNSIEAETTPKAKYKLLEMKNPFPNRRKMANRRFIQEENQDGVVIIRLDDQPFPDFHLPRTRRQYMTDTDSAELVEDSGMYPDANLLPIL